MGKECWNEGILRDSTLCIWLPGVVVHTCNPNTQEAEAGELQVWGLSELYRRSSLKKVKTKKKERERKQTIMR
jgi:hypothetical protein